MPTRPIERLLFAQGGLCFFCKQKLVPTEATVEHLVARTNGGENSDENTVACCKSLNSLFGRMSLKEKLGVVLNQNGLFKCPNGPPKPKKAAALPDGAYERVLSDLQKRGASRPRTVKTLTATIHSLFQKGLTPAQLDTLIAKLQASGVIKVEGTKVAYELSGHT